MAISNDASLVDSLIYVQPPIELSTALVEIVSEFCPPYLLAQSQPGEQNSETISTSAVESDAKPGVDDVTRSTGYSYN